MEQQTLAQNLSAIRARDYQFNATMMPQRARFLNKLFAKMLGESAGKVITTYDSMYEQLQNGDSVGEVQRTVRKDMKQKAGVSIKIPFLKPKHARICGLAAMNYSGFLDNEVELASALMTDLNENSVTSLDDILTQTRQVSLTNPEKYEPLLEEKQQAIQDFGILMGLKEDNERFDELKITMHPNAVHYFDMVAAMHKGGRLGISWPLPLKSFSEPLREGLSQDTLSHAMQEGLGKDYGFKMPQEKEYNLMISELQNTLEYIASRKNPIARKWQIATALPASLFFLAGLESQAYGGICQEGFAPGVPVSLIKKGVSVGTTITTCAPKEIRITNSTVTTGVGAGLTLLTTAL